MNWARFPYIDGLKVDVQGHDYEVLLGSDEIIHRICYIFIEIVSDNQYKDCPEKYNLMKSYLETKGFTLVHIAPRGYKALFKNLRIPHDYISTVEPLFIDS